MNRWGMYAAMAMLIVLAGCGIHPVEIQTEPEGATVELSLPENGGAEQVVRLPSETPVSYDLDFSKSATGRITVRASLEEYLDTEEVLTSQSVQNLPQVNGKRVLVLEMERAPFQDVEKAEVVVDQKQGLTIQYRTVRAFREDIERQGISVSKIVQLGRGMSIGGLTVSGDGTRVAFGVVEEARDQKGNPVRFSNIRSIHTSGGGITQVTTGRWLDIDPCFSLDGGHLYFASNRLRNNGLDIFRISSKSIGGGVAVIYRQNDGWSRSPSAGQGNILSLSYLPQYARTRGVPHIWTLGGNNEYPTQLREGSQPRMSPDGKWIVFVGPDKKLWLNSTGTEAPIQLTTNPETEESHPVWSPNGDHIVFVSDEGTDSTGENNNDIWIMRADGTGRRQLTTNGSDDTTPAVDPEGRWIYFVSNRGFRWGVWRMAWPSDLGS